MAHGAQRRSRFVSLAAVAVLCFGAAYVPPAAGVEPSAPPVVEPAPADPAPSPAPSPATTAVQPEAATAPTPSATPGPTPVPGSAEALLGPLPEGAVEVVRLRTETSRTFLRADGARVTDFYTRPVFYQPGDAGSPEPVDPGFHASSLAGVAGVSDRAPVTVTVRAAADPAGFLSLAAGTHAISFRLPGAAAKGAGSAAPVIDRTVADTRDFLPGTDLRVIAGAEGARSFFIWAAPPADPAVTYVADAPGLALRPGDDGSISFVDADGTVVGRIPHPYAVDSTPDPFTGSGRFTDAVGLTLAPDERTITVRVDPAWLRTAVYPVYVDPSVDWYNAGSTSYGDAHVASGYPTHNYANYVRPDAPYYAEMWNGVDPSGISGESYDFLRWDVSSLDQATIDAATLSLFPYHQYYNAPTVQNTAARQVTGAWTESAITWNTRPTGPINTVTAGACVEGTTCTWNVRTIVANWAADLTTNKGVQVDTNGHGSTYWKRFIASEQGGTSRPRLSVTSLPRGAVGPRPRRGVRHRRQQHRQHHEPEHGPDLHRHRRRGRHGHPVRRARPHRPRIRGGHRRRLVDHGRRTVRGGGPQLHREGQGHGARGSRLGRPSGHDRHDPADPDRRRPERLAHRRHRALVHDHGLREPRLRHDHGGRPHPDRGHVRQLDRRRGRVHDRADLDHRRGRHGHELRRRRHRVDHRCRGQRRHDHQRAARHLDRRSHEANGDDDRPRGGLRYWQQLHRQHHQRRVPGLRPGVRGERHGRGRG